MTKTLTPRFELIQYGVGTDSPKRVEFNDAFAKIEARAMLTQQGAVASRGNPITATKGRIHTVAGDADPRQNSRLYYDNGSEWVLIGKTIADAVAYSDAPNRVPITVKGSPAQSSNLQEWKDSNDVTLAAVTASGGISAIGNALGGASAQRLVISQASNKIADIVRGAPSQSVDLVQWQNDVSVVMARIDQSGGLSASSLSAPTANVPAINASTSVTTPFVKITDIEQTDQNNPIRVHAIGTSNTILHTAFLDQSDTIVASIGRQGGIRTNYGIRIAPLIAASAVAWNESALIESLATDAVTLRVKGSNAQTADLLRLTDNADSVRLALSPAGLLTVAGGGNFGGDITTPSRVMVNAGTTGEKLRLYSSEAYGLGVQSSSVYFRTGGAFNWYKGGVFEDGGAAVPGTGGTLLMGLASDARLTVTRINITATNTGTSDHGLAIGSRTGTHLGIGQNTIDAYSSSAHTTGVPLYLQYYGTTGNDLILGASDTKVSLPSRTLWTGANRVYWGNGTWSAQGGGPISNDWWFDYTNNQIKVFTDAGNIWKVVADDNWKPA